MSKKQLNPRPELIGAKKPPAPGMPSDEQIRKAFKSIEVAAEKAGKRFYKIASDLQKGSDQFIRAMNKLHRELIKSGLIK